MCYNKELCDKMMATTEKRLDAHAAELDRLAIQQENLLGRLDGLVTQLANTNKLLWWIVGIFGTVSAGTVATLVGMVVR